MAKAIKPINKKNAIEAATFALVFERPFNDQETQTILGLGKSLQKDLPSSTVLNKIMMRMENEKLASQANAVNGILLQNFKKDGKPDWALRVADNTITVTCTDYNEWVKVWAKTERFFKATSKCLEIETHRVVALVLQIVDQFVTTGDLSDYSIYDVFREDSPFLTAKAAQSNHLWHVHQGWFQELEPIADVPSRCLHVLNISTNEMHDGRHVSTIDHAAQHQFFVEPVNFDAILGDKILANAFEKLHDSNKELVKQTINDKQATAIGLI